MGRIGRAALAYFAAVFAVGFVLGVVREMVVRPRLGATAAIALEAPAMLLATLLIACRVVRHFDLAAGGARLRTGLVAFALLMAAECAGSIALRGMTPSAWLAHFAEPDGVLSLALFLAFAAMPWAAGKACFR
ncbi:MAG: hypothetical protein IT556_10455 [Acetobacteraceae bacterium]|nr:hypothetical protein [Acetobacteraceae bacterium]